MKKTTYFMIFAFMVTFVLTAGPALAADKPNILFIFADDMCYEAIHALGYDEIETPNLDRLVDGGTQQYVTEPITRAGELRNASAHEAAG